MHIRCICPSRAPRDLPALPALPAHSHHRTSTSILKSLWPRYPYRTVQYQGVAATVPHTRTIRVRVALLGRNTKNIEKYRKTYRTVRQAPPAPSYSYEYSYSTAP